MCEVTGFLAIGLDAGLLVIILSLGGLKRPHNKHMSCPGKRAEAADPSLE